MPSLPSLPHPPENQPNPLEDDLHDDQQRPEQYAVEDEEDAEQDHLAPSHWWISSTLFPLLAATFAPIASAFSICALVVDWRIVVTNEQASEAEGPALPDPAWLYAVNAVSLLIAVLSNLTLLSNMANRVSFQITQPLVVVGFYSASIILIALEAAEIVYLKKPSDTLSQAFYYACFASAIYFLVASMLVVTAYGAYIGRYAVNYKLTTAQRTLMLQVIMYLGYLLASAAVYSRIEGWNFLDAVYWADVTLFTIGFGDYAPKTHLGRSLFFPYAVGGILFVGLIVASISSLVLSPGSNKVSHRNLEKARQSVMKHMSPESGTVRVGLKKVNISAANDGSELAQREHEFDVMRMVQQRARFVNALVSLSFIVAIFCVIWLIGAVVFWQAEMGTGNWSYFEALYFTYVSFLTIGYGDFEPQASFLSSTNPSLPAWILNGINSAAKPAFVMWSLIALPTLTVLIGSVGSTISEGLNTLTLAVAERLPKKNGSSAIANLQRTAEKMKKGRTGEFAEIGPGFEPNTARDSGADGQRRTGTIWSDSSAIEDPAHRDAVSKLAEGASVDDPKNIAYRPYLRLRELRNIVNHLGASPPRKYTYAEWTWILKLLGEDEGDSSTHRRAEAVKEAEHKEGRDREAEEKKVRGETQPWSWLGRKSPLMSGMDEPQWVLDKLLDALEGELKELGDLRKEKEHRKGEVGRVV